MPDRRRDANGPGQRAFVTDRGRNDGTTSANIMAFWQIFLATYYRYGPATLIFGPTLKHMLIDVRWLQYLLKRPAHK
ncbi:hypothetical protein [Mycolicibacterium sp. CBM1]